MNSLTPPSAPAAPASARAGWAAALVATAAFSVAAPIATFIIGWGTDPTTMLVLRLWLATGLLFATLAIFAPARLRLDRRGLLAIVLAGPAMGLAVLLFFWSLTRLHTSIASMLVALEPLMALFLLRLRGERFTYRNTVRLALGLAGVYLLVGLQGSADWLGLLMVLGTVLGSAFQTVALQWYFSGYDGRTITFYIVLMMALTVSVVWLIQGAVWQPPIWQSWVGILALALVPTYLARLGLFAAVQRLGGGQVALLAPLETFLTVIWAVVFLHDRLTLIQLAGGALILLSAILAVQRLRRARPRPTSAAPADSTGLPEL